MKVILIICVSTIFIFLAAMAILGMACWVAALYIVEEFEKWTESGSR